ncbi:tRNA lysidine(34) synthetase TilS [Candidatus Pelagibacter sp.]|nr:tRNA lysidine(34) synthetase TilS [Candidatus Pelagibacter sp.]
MSLKNSSVRSKIPKPLKDNLKDSRINKIYKRFENDLNISENFVVAVSGGPDSLALAFLAKIYSVKKRLVPKFLIVDHKLRAESSKEAKNVKKILKAHSINSKILIWKGTKPVKNIQSTARKIRYELLFKESDKFKINSILIAHHRDDLIENFFLRMLRGSGLKGLISLDKKSKIKNKILLRPLISQKKEDLVFIAQNVFNFYVKDPTNQDEKYQRIIIRNLIKELKKKGLNKKKFINTIKNLKSSNEVINFCVNQNLRKNSIFIEKKEKIILKKEYFNQPHEVIFRSLSESIMLVGRKYYPVRGKKLVKIISNIKNNRLFKLTIGGCIIQKVNQTIIISKEH